MRLAPLALAVALIVSAHAASAQTATELFDQGAAAHDRGDLEEARAKYAASLALHQSPRTAANLGVVEGLLGRHRDAAEHLAFALARYRDEGDETRRQRMAEELSRVLGYVGELRVEAPAGLEIVVDGRVAGTAPLVMPVYVEPGVHRVEGRSPGGAPLPIEVRIEAGEARDVRLGARRAEAAAETPGPLAPRVDLAGPRPPPEPAATVDPVIVVGGAGLTLAGVVLGATFAVASEGDDGFETASIVSFVGAGAAALGTVAYLVILGADDGGGEAARLVVAPAAHTAGGGLIAGGRF